jgi:hypothetical protein
MPTVTEKKKLKQNLEIRRALSDAYAFVVGANFTRGVNDLTLEDLLQAHIEAIEGLDGITAIRPNKLDALNKMVSGISDLVEQVMKTPAKSFQIEVDDRVRTSLVANTPETEK